MTKILSIYFRQITASVTFLPYLEELCSFDVLIYTGKQAEAPSEWTESSACLIENAEQVCFKIACYNQNEVFTYFNFQVQLRSFSTAVHTVSTNVQYKID